MAYIDTGLSGYGGIAAAPTGGGIGANAQATVSAGAPGSSGLGSGHSVRNWVLIYYVIMIGILVFTGVIFNGKGGAK